VVKDTNLFAGTYNAGVFRSTDNGLSWSKPDNQLIDTTVFAFAINGENLFAGTYPGSILLSSDNSTSWRVVNTEVGYVTSLVFRGTDLFASTSSGVFLSPNNGTSWDAINSGLENTVVYALTLKGSYLFAGALGNSGGVFRLDVDSTNWHSYNNGLTNKNVRALLVNGINLFAGTEGGVFRTTNDGLEWNAVNDGLTGINIYAFVLNGMNLFVGTLDNGVFISTNNGQNWSAVNEGLTNTQIMSLTIKDGYLFAGTYLGGIWRRPLSEMVTSNEQFESEVSKRYTLFQNYPNPFNPATKIKFRLQYPVYTRIEIYNSSGQKISTLLNNYLQAGDHEIDFKAQKLSSGIYFYTIQAGDFHDVKKMILLK
jgi:ligand-binding sensor domain-containing protein